MRKTLFLCSAIGLLAAISPAFVAAQFQPPNPDELKMTADPKAPRADAVYLYREETADDDLHFHSYYERIKVLKENGRELATVRIPYVRGESKVAKIEGRTIHSDGTVIPLTVKPEDLLDLRTKHFQENTIVFTLPSVEVGSILEYRLQLRYGGDAVEAPRWDIQRPYFVHKAHYSFRPAWNDGEYVTNDRGQRLDNLMYTVTPAKGPIVVQIIHDRYTVDLSDIPPVPDEDWMPPLNTLSWRVEFYYTSAASALYFWAHQSAWWAQETEAFIRPTSTLTQAAANLVSLNDSDEQKARKIYAAVMKLDNTDYSRVKSDTERKTEKFKEVQSADDVWKAQSGDGNSIALLYVALARAAGLQVWPMVVTDRNLAIFDANYLNMSQLTDYIAVVVLNGKDVYVDPGRRMCPFGSLYWAHTLAGGLRETDTGPVQTQTPDSTYKENAVRRDADLTVDADGNVKGWVRISLSGAEALYWRQLALKNDEDEVKKEFSEGLRDDLPEGVNADFDHFIGLADYESNLMAVVNLNGTLGEATGKHFFLPALLFESHAQHPFVAQDKRTTPIDVHFPRLETDDVVYHLPPGYGVESSLKPVDVKWPGFAVLRINCDPQADGVEVERVFERNFTVLGPEAYADLHDFYSKVASADASQLVLDLPAAAKGN